MSNPLKSWGTGLVVMLVALASGLAWSGNVCVKETWDLGAFIPAEHNALLGLTPSALTNTETTDLKNSGLTFGGVEKLTDGQCTGGQDDVAECYAICSGATIAYTLAAPTDIAEIRIYSRSHNKSHDEIYLKGIDVSVDSGATWTTLDNTQIRYSNDSTYRCRVCLLTDDGTMLATLVNAIRFRFNTQEKGFVEYIELEAIGNPHPVGQVRFPWIEPTGVTVEGVCTSLGVGATSAEFYFACGPSAEGLEPVRQPGTIEACGGSVAVSVGELDPGVDYHYAYFLVNDIGFTNEVATGIFHTASAAGVLCWDPGQTRSAGGGAGGWFDEGAWYDPVAGENVTWDASCEGKDLLFGGAAGRIQLNAPVNSDVLTGILYFLVEGYVIDLESAPQNQSKTSSNLTCAGVSGEDAQIYKTYNARDKTFTMNVAEGVNLSWNGAVAGSGSSRFHVTKTGEGSQSIRKANMSTTQGQPVVTVEHGQLSLTGTGSGGIYSKWFVLNDAILDIGNNSLAVRQIDVDEGATVISCAGGTFEQCEGRYENARVDGWLTGDLKFKVSSSHADGVYAVLSNPLNDYTGGTYITGELKNGTKVAHLRVTADTALGTGPVVLDNKSNTASLEFESAEPVIGSLASANAGQKQVLLGGEQNDTVLTVGLLDTDTDFGGTIMDANGHVGSLVKVGEGTLTLSGTNTYTGMTSVREGALRLGNGAMLSTLNIEVDGGELTGPTDGVGIIDCDLSMSTGPITLISGTLDLTNLGFVFEGRPASSPVVLVDYSQGGTLVLGDELFATGVPEGFKIIHDTACQQILLTGNGLRLIVR